MSDDGLTGDDAFTGSIPRVRCRSLSGVDCDRWVSPDDENCGIPEHVIPTRELPTIPDDVSGAQVRRPRIAVVDEYTVVPHGAVDSLDPTTFDPDRLHIARSVLDAFTDHHGVDDDVARAELRSFVKAALMAGRIEETAGKHIASWKKIRVTISRDGNALLRYQTRHYERLPSEVLTGAPSRFGSKSSVRRHVDDSGPDALSEREVLELVRSDRARLSERLLGLFARRNNFGTDLDRVEPRLRSVLAEAGTLGSFERAEDGGSVRLEYAGQGWIIGMPSGVVVAMYDASDAEA